MKDTILWLQLQTRKKPVGHELYSSITDMGKWIKRSSGKKTAERARLFFQLLVEVNELDLPVHERLIFLEQLHSPVIILIDQLAKKYTASGLPLAEDKARIVEIVNTFWSEMAKGHKIIIDDLSESGFFKSLINQKYLICALYSVSYYLNAQLLSNYMLYSACSENVWRDLHQVYRFASKRGLSNKSVTHHFTTNVDTELTIGDRYKKILLFALANPYHLSIIEMESLWSNLDRWSKYTDVNLDTSQVLKKEYPFIIKPYSDQPPFSNHNNNASGKTTESALSDFNSDSVWGLETKKLIKRLDKKKNQYSITTYFYERLLRAWMGTSSRQLQREELIEPVVIAIGVSCISQFLSQIDIMPKILKLEDECSHKLEPTLSVYSFYQAYLIDESKKGIRLKVNHETEKLISPNMGEVIAIKYSDDSVQIGYLRWLRETPEGDVEFGVEFLCAMAEPVQLSKETLPSHFVHGENDSMSVLDSFVFPGNKEHHYKPILFTHTFIENFYNTKTDHLKLSHKTGSINIKLTQKVNEVLDYSLYLFEKIDAVQLTEQQKRSKAAQFEKMWDKI